MRSAPGPRVFLVSGATAIGKLTAGQQSRGGTVPFRPLGRGKLRALTPSRIAAPGPSLRVPALAALHHSRSARPCHIPVVLSFYGRGKLSPFLVVTRGSAWNTTNQDK